MIAGLLQKVRNSSEIADCTSQAAMTYIYRWDRQGRKGQRCKVLARGTMNSCCVEFEDGYTMVTSRNALKRASARGSSEGQDHARAARDCLQAMNIRDDD